MNSSAKKPSSSTSLFRLYVLVAEMISVVLGEAVHIPKFMNKRRNFTECDAI